MSETDISRHYTELCKQVHGVNCGFYPLGSCTMKYNPRIDEEMAALPGFADVHPLSPAEDLDGMQQVLDTAAQYLCEITGMDGMTFQPAAGAHGEFTGVLLIKQYHDARGDHKRTKIIVPDSAHGTNPATAAMCGYDVVNIASGPDGCVDLDALRAALGEDTAGLMLTTPTPWVSSTRTFWRSPASSTRPAACATTTVPTSTPLWAWCAPAIWALTAST